MEQALNTVKERHGVAAYTMHKSSLDVGDTHSNAKAAYDSEMAKAEVSREQALNTVKERHGVTAYNMHKSCLDTGITRSNAKATYDSEMAKAEVSREQALNVVKERHGDAGYNMHKASLDVNVKDEAGWDEKFQRLKAYKEEHGHCDVPQGGTDAALASWVSNQRRRKDTLSVDQRRRLEALGFKWNLHDAAWDEKFRRLEAYKIEHRHCNLSQYGTDADLGRWVNKQRTKMETLSVDKVWRLTKLGFEWKVKVGRKKR